MSEVILDCGGDHKDGLEVIVNGAIEALVNSKANITLVGPQKAKEILDEELALGYTEYAPRIEFQEAERVYGMHEGPKAVLKPKNEHVSIRVASRLAAERDAPLVSAGNTGATRLACQKSWGKLSKNISLGIAGIFPCIIKEKEHSRCVVCDLGATQENKPKDLLDYARMCNSYAERYLCTENPKIGLINSGTEPWKGRTLEKETYTLLKNSPFNFIGNIEPSHVFEGEVDIAIVSGHVGNIKLKTAEAVVKLVKQNAKLEVETSGYGYKTWAYLSRYNLKKMSKRLDPKQYSGSLILGLNKLCFVCHGSSDEIAIKHAVKRAHNHASLKNPPLTERIREDLRNYENSNMPISS